MQNKFYQKMKFMIIPVNIQELTPHQQRIIYKRAGDKNLYSLH